MAHVPFIDQTELERLAIIFVTVGNAIQSWRNGQKASVSQDLLQKHIDSNTASAEQKKE